MNAANSPRTHSLPKPFSVAHSSRWYGQTLCRHSRLHQQADSSKRQKVISRGLLDSYRRDKGSANPPSNSSTSSTLERPAQEEVEEEGDPEVPCSVECVQQVYSAEEFDKAVNGASPNTLVVVDFYKTACGSCKYIQPGFVKLCRGSQEEHAPVIFLKHNVIDEADQPTELGINLKIRNVPLFHFYRDGELLEQFATRDRKRIGNAINRHVGREVIHI